MSSPPGQSIELATKFYQYDHELTTETRKDLTSAFRNQQYYPAGLSLAAVFLGAMAPRQLASRGLIPARFASSRYMAVGLAFFGFLAGGQVGFMYAYRSGLGRFDEGSNARNAYQLLSMFPPQVGIAYYQTTSRDPSTVMSDPRAIDWTREPKFPFNLIKASIMANRRRGMAGREPAVQLPDRTDVQISRGSNELSSGQTNEEPFDWDPQPKKPDFSTMSSWDTIRQGKAQTNIGRNQKQSEDTSEDSKRQAEFDRELDRERGGGEGAQDDFTESERRWTS